MIKFDFIHMISGQPETGEGKINVSLCTIASLKTQSTLETLGIFFNFYTESQSTTQLVLGIIRQASIKMFVVDPFN